MSCFILFVDVVSQLQENIRYLKEQLTEKYVLIFFIPFYVCIYKRFMFCCSVEGMQVCGDVMSPVQHLRLANPTDNRNEDQRKLYKIIAKVNKNSANIAQDFASIIWLLTLI